MKTAWVVFENFYDVAEQSFVGVFTSKDDAIAYVRDHLTEDFEVYDEKDWYIREVPLNDRALLD